MVGLVRLGGKPKTALEPALDGRPQDRPEKF